MNAKAERIEQIIQVVNRNLQLVCTGQSGSTALIEAKVLHRIDTSVFGNDKFAYEMLQYVKTGIKMSGGGGMAAIWDRHFLKALETLLVECAVVKDELERDCFIGRLYSWFTEKVVERRDLPREPVGQEGLNDLKNSIAAMGGTYTVKALDKYMQTTKLSPGISRDQAEQGVDPDKQKSVLVNTDMPIPQESLQAPRSLPVYIRHAYPDLRFVDEDLPDTLQSQRDRTVSPGHSPMSANKTDGYNDNNDDTEVERGLNALFVAKRRQEAFEWKARQQYALVLDRRALHMSRLESDALRRTESSSLMGQGQTSSGGDQFKSSINKFAPEVKRPFSAKRRVGGQALSTWPGPGPAADSPDPRMGDPAGFYKQDSLNSVDNVQADLTMKVSSYGYEVETTAVPKAARNAVNRRSIGSVDSQTLPMRFRNELPEDYRRNMQRLRHYLQEHSDSDEDEKDRKNPKQPDASALIAATISLPIENRKASRSSSISPIPAMAAAAATAPVLSRKVVQKQKPAVHERPHSAIRLREMAAHDPELQVHYRHSNYRRMPVTAEIENWIDNRETQRRKKAHEKIAELKESRAGSRGAKSKPGSSSKSGKSPSPPKGKGRRGKKTDSQQKKDIKYRSASQFMAIHFPAFDNDTRSDGHGPLRACQLMECERIHALLEDSDINVPLKTLQKGLVTPQDRPELVCAENLRSGSEGLMENPLPKEYWRTAGLEKRPKSKKTGKRSKK